MDNKHLDGQTIFFTSNAMPLMASVEGVPLPPKASPMTSPTPGQLKARASVRQAMNNINGGRDTAARPARTAAPTQPKTTTPKPSLEVVLQSVQASEPGLDFDSAWSKAYAITMGDSEPSTAPTLGSPAAKSFDNFARTVQVKAEAQRAVQVSQVRAAERTKATPPKRTFPAVVQRIASAVPPMSLEAATALLAAAQKADDAAQAAYVAATSNADPGAVTASETFQGTMDRLSRKFPHLGLDAVWTMATKERSTLI